MEDVLLLNSIERYLEGRMLPDEKAFFNELRKSTPEIDQMVVEHILFLQQMNAYSEKTSLKALLHDVHFKLADAGDIKSSDQPETVGGKVVQFWSRSKKVVAIAASIAGVTALIISVIIASFSPSIDNNRLQQLGRDVEQIKKSQQFTNNKLNQFASETTKIPQGAIVKTGGTAFLIDGKGYLVTNAHVLNGTGAIVANAAGREFNARILSVDALHDLALLKIEDSEYHVVSTLPYSIKKSEADLGDELFTLGYPRDQIVYNLGYLSSKTGFENDTSSYQISLSANPGNSGAPVFNKNGDVIGILSTRQLQAEGVVFASKSSNIFCLMSDLKNIDSATAGKITVSANSSSKSTDRVAQIKKASDCVYQVKAYNQE